MHHLIGENITHVGKVSHSMIRVSLFIRPIPIPARVGRSVAGVYLPRKRRARTCLPRFPLFSQYAALTQETAHM